MFTMSEKDELLHKAQSETINLLRFPMAVLVILIHTDWYYASWHSEIKLTSGEGICFLIGYILRTCAEISVPTFFLFSGFLFFNNFRDFTWNGYKNKIKSRFKTLIIPYIVWNVVVYTVAVSNKITTYFTSKEESWDKISNYIIENNIHFLWDINHWGDTTHPWMWWTTYSTGPIDSPLWFLRDLIVITFLSPLIFFIIKKLKILSVFILSLAYVLSFWITWHGFGIEAFFFFTLGAYMSINKINLVAFCRKNNTAIFICTVVFIILSMLSFIPSDYSSILRKSLYISLIFISISIASYIVVDKGMHANPLLVSSCFFIYACHIANLPIAPVSMVYMLSHSVISGDDYFSQLIRFITVPIITATILLAIYWLLMRYFPKIGRIFCGGR